ncbi:LysR family transcriptional regulator [Streptomyces sp. RK75]|nr:LysR family transcriptional regulator [Streptomyces sp. RK75]
MVAAGSFRTAAQRLGYTPSAVSQQISTVERALGVQLFERSPRSVRPTPAGLQLARRAGRLLADLTATEKRCVPTPPPSADGCGWAVSGPRGSGWCRRC